MKVFSLYLQSSMQLEQFDNIVSFVGKDSSGSFGILADHTRLMTSLKIGLARFRYDNGQEEYIALPGGILYFVDNQLKIATRYYLRSDDYKKIAEELDKKMSEEKTDISDLKETLRRLDEGFLRYLWKLKRTGEV